jgi:hypothetical protein
MDLRRATPAERPVAGKVHGRAEASWRILFLADLPEGGEHATQRLVDPAQVVEERQDQRPRDGAEHLHHRAAGGVLKHLGEPSCAGV